MAGYTRTFLDSGVLITAFNGERHLMERALAVLDAWRLLNWAFG
jgi:hypothetical protein